MKCTLFILLLLLSLDLTAQCPNDYPQLVDWYNNNPSLQAAVNWNTPPQSLTDASMTGWEGITQNGKGCVTELILLGKNINGAIPNFNLPYLEKLILSNNQLSDTIPAFNLSNLQYLVLSNNQLSGCIPPSLKINCPLIGMTGGSISYNLNLSTEDWAAYWNNGDGACVTCNTVTSAGTIGQSQMSCQAPFDPAPFSSLSMASSSTGGVIEYTWYKGTTATFNYTWQKIPNATASNYDSPSLSQTTYFVRVARLSTCTDSLASNVVRVKIGTNPVFSPTQITQLKCFGDKNASINIALTGTAPFVYTWSHDPTLNSAHASDLSAGLYQVTVTGADNCTATQSNTIVAPPRIERNTR
jgi:Leucine Rich repeats (2 copies)